MRAALSAGEIEPRLHGLQPTMLGTTELLLQQRKTDRFLFFLFVLFSSPFNAIIMDYIWTRLGFWQYKNVVDGPLDYWHWLTLWLI